MRRTSGRLRRLRWSLAWTILASPRWWSAWGWEIHTARRSSSTAPHTQPRSGHTREVGDSVEACFVGMMSMEGVAVATHVRA
jgi:hypothetical protein